MTDSTDSREKLWKLIKDIRFGMLTHRGAEGELEGNEENEDGGGSAGQVVGADEDGEGPEDDEGEDAELPDVRLQVRGAERGFLRAARSVGGNSENRSETHAAPLQTAPGPARRMIAMLQV